MKVLVSSNIHVTLFIKYNLIKRGFMLQFEHIRTLLFFWLILLAFHLSLKVWKTYVGYNNKVSIYLNGITWNRAKYCIYKWSCIYLPFCYLFRESESHKLCLRRLHIETSQIQNLEQKIKCIYCERIAQNTNSAYYHSHKNIQGIWSPVIHLL